MPLPLALAPADRAGARPSVERRAFERFATDLLVSCWPVAAGRADSWPARLRDISAGGIGLVVERRFERGTMLAVDLANVGSGSSRTLLSRVMHAEPQPEGEWLLGLALLREMSEDELSAWGAAPARPERPDGRAWVRFPCAIPGSCTDAAAAEAAPWQATVVNVSPGGFGLVSDRAVRQGAHLYVDLPGADGQMARRLVRVAHARQQADGCWRLGCELTDSLGEDEASVGSGQGELPDGTGPEEVALSAPVSPEVEGNPAGDTGAERSITDPDLARVCAAWPALPPHIRAAVTALIAVAH